MKISYARVSTREQSPENHLSGLADAGCEMFFEEKVSGAVRRRPRLKAMLEQLRKDDVVVVTKLDCLARSTIELLRITEVLNEKSAGIQSLDEPWADSTSPPEMMIMTIFGWHRRVRAIPHPDTDTGRTGGGQGSRGCVRAASEAQE